MVNKSSFTSQFYLPSHKWLLISVLIAQNILQTLVNDEVPYELMNNTLLQNALWAFEMARNMIGRWHIVGDKPTIVVPDIFPSTIHIRDEFLMGHRLPTD